MHYRTNSEDQVYRSYMRSLQLDSVDFSLSGSQAHAFASSYNKAGTPSSQVIIRVAQEVSSLSTSLPLDFSSAIFIRSDDDKATLLRAIITGSVTDDHLSEQFMKLQMHHCLCHMLVLDISTIMSILLQT